MNNYSEEYYLEFIKSRKHYKKTIEKVKESYFSCLLNVLAKVRDSKQFWSAVKKIKKFNFQESSLSIARFVEYYNNFNYKEFGFSKYNSSRIL